MLVFHNPVRGKVVEHLATAIMAGRPMKRKACDITAECLGNDRYVKSHGSFLILELEGSKPFKSRGGP